MSRGVFRAIARVAHAGGWVDAGPGIESGHRGLDVIPQRVESSLAAVAVAQVKPMAAQTLGIKSARSRSEIRRWRNFGFRGGVATALGEIRVELAQDVCRGVLRAIVDAARTIRRGH